MQENFHYKKELRWLLPQELTIRDEYRLYAPRERTDLSHSIPESGIIQPLTTVAEDELNILLDGFDRHGLSTVFPDVKIPVWVITDQLTEMQKKKLILDLGRQKQKTKTDYLKEYEVYNTIVPNEQGKTKGGHNRHKLIAGMIGISTSQLSQILMINKARPSLLVEVDNDHRTLSEAQQVAKQIKRERKNVEAAEKSEGISSPGKKVDMKPKFDVCPTCHRRLSETDWGDVPSMFPFKRDETNNQTNWLEPITDADLKELEEGFTGATDATGTTVPSGPDRTNGDDGSDRVDSITGPIGAGENNGTRSYGADGTDEANTASRTNAAVSADEAIGGTNQNIESDEK